MAFLVAYLTKYIYLSSTIHVAMQSSVPLSTTKLAELYRQTVMDKIRLSIQSKESSDTPRSITQRKQGIYGRI